MVKKKSDLIDELARMGYVKSQAKEVVNDILIVLSKWMAAHYSVSLHGFGGWSVQMHKGHPIQNANTKEIEVIPDYPVIKFTPGNNLKDAVKSGDAKKMTVLLQGD